MIPALIIMYFSANVSVNYDQVWTHDILRIHSSPIFDVINTQGFKNTYLTEAKQLKTQGF